MRRWIIGVIVVLAISVAGLALFSTFAQSAYVSVTARSSYGSISLHGDERVGQTIEVDVHADWHKAAATTLVRLDGIAGWKTTRFAPDGYESREFCDDDNVPEAIRLGRGSVVWGTGNLWPGASCDVRLFLIPTVPGGYRIRARLLAEPRSNPVGVRSIKAVDSVLRVTVRHWWGA